MHTNPNYIKPDLNEQLSHQLLDISKLLYPSIIESDEATISK